MKVLIRKTSLKGLLPWVQRVLFAGGTLMLGYCGFALLDTWLFQRWETQNLERLARSEPASPEFLPAIARGGLIGRVEIPRLGVSVVFVEGTANSALRRAAGHIVGTALPGQIGNIGIAGHRDTFFRPLRDILPDDVITV